MKRWLEGARSRWSALPRAERVAWCVVLVLPLLGLLPAPLLARVDPPLAAWVAWDAKPSGWEIYPLGDDRSSTRGFVDPWGSGWISLRNGMTYSPGPNRRDDDMVRDDVHVTVVRSTTLPERLLARSVAVGFAAAAVLAWAILLARFVRAPRRSLAAEVRGVALQVGLSVACWGGLLYWAMFSEERPFRWWLRWLREGSEALHAGLPAPPGLHPVAADAAAVALVWALFCLWLRAEPRNAARARRLLLPVCCVVASLGMTSSLLVGGRSDHATAGEVALSLLLAALVAVAAVATLAFARPPAPPLPDPTEA